MDYLIEMIGKEYDEDGDNETNQYISTGSEGVPKCSVQSEGKARADFDDVRPGIVSERLGDEVRIDEERGDNEDEVE